jgi:hypothetical protein
MPPDRADHPDRMVVKVVTPALFLGSRDVGDYALLVGDHLHLAWHFA